MIWFLGYSDCTTNNAFVLRLWQLSSEFSAVTDGYSLLVLISFSSGGVYIFDAWFEMHEAKFSPLQNEVKDQQGTNANETMYLERRRSRFKISCLSP